MQIFWSAIWLCYVWHNMRDPRCLDRACWKTNRELENVMVGGLGQFLPHPGIQADLSKLYQDNLSNKGNNIFLGDIWKELHAALGY